MNDVLISFSFDLPSSDTRPSPAIVHGHVCPRPGIAAGSVAELLSQYMSVYRGRDPSIGQRLGFWRDHLGMLAVTEVTDDHVYEGLRHLRETPALRYLGKDANDRPIHKVRGKRTPATVNRYLAALGGVFSWAIRERQVPRGWQSPCRRGLRLFGEASGNTRFLAEDERARLLQACRSSKWPRLYMLVVMALTTGARRGEMLGLRWSDIDFSRQEARIATTKNGSPKVLPLVPVVMEELRRLHEADTAKFKQGCPAKYVFRATRGRGGPCHFHPFWYQALADAKVEDCRFHDLRHSCASYLAQNGASLLEIADVLGHKQLAMTKRYSHLTTATKKALVGRVLGDIR